ADGDRRRGGHAVVHGPGAGDWAGRGGGARSGRVRLGGDLLRVPHRPAAVPGGDGPGDAGAGLRPRAGAAAAAATPGAARPGNHLPEVPAQGAAQALRQRRRAACAGTRTRSPVWPSPPTANDWPAAVWTTRRRSGTWTPAGRSSSSPSRASTSWTFR